MAAITQVRILVTAYFFPLVIANEYAAPKVYCYEVIRNIPNSIFKHYFHLSGHKHTGDQGHYASKSRYMRCCLHFYHNCNDNSLLGRSRTPCCSAEYQEQTQPTCLAEEKKNPKFFATFVIVSMIECTNCSK